MKGSLLKIACTIVLACSLLISLTAFTVPDTTKAAPAGARNGLPQSATLTPTHKNGAPATWTCPTYTQAWKYAATTIAGYGQTNCSVVMETIDMTEYAMYCQPVLWGCLWFNQGQIGSGCTFTNVAAGTSVFCPKKGVATWSKNIDPGELWAIQTYTCAYASDATSACGGTQQDVQF